MPSPRRDLQRKASAKFVYFDNMSEAAPGGISEPGVPCMAPAVANALFAATGKRLRRLPVVALGLTLG